MTFKCGQKPDTGRYVCTNCEADLYLDDDTDKLPQFSKCDNCEFENI